MIELEAVEVLRPGPAAVLRARHQGEAVLAKVTAPVVPWTDSRSAFFGGVGLTPPFQALPFHEADAWARVDPGRIVVAGEGPDGALWLVLRELPGRRLAHGHGDARCLLTGLLSALASFHARDVLHRDLRPENVLVDGEAVALVDLDVARVAGLGPVGLVGSRAWRAPEAEVGEGDARTDLYGVAKLVLAACPEVPPELRPLLEALTAPSPSDRSRSAAEALASLGEPAAPAPAISPPSAWARSHWATAWADVRLAVGDVWETVRAADRAALEVPALAAVAARLLARAPAAGGETWLALGALCWALHARTGDARYAAQADEARVYARAGWHPASRALDGLLSRSMAGDIRIEALCALGLPAVALEEAVASRRAGHIARAAWALGDRARTDAALRAGSPDPLSIAVAASRTLLADRGVPSDDVLANALPEDALEAVRLRVATGRIADAAALAAALPGVTGVRAGLTVSLARHDLAGAFEAARSLAAGEAWDASVAATLLADAEAPAGLRAQARVVLAGALHVPEEPAALSALAALGARPSEGEAWGRLLALLLDAERLDLAGTAVGLVGDAAGPVPWRLLAGVLVAGGDGDAAAVLDEASRRWPDDLPLAILRACHAGLAHDRERATRGAREILATVPEDPRAWLLLGLLAEDPVTRARAIRTAEALGAGPEAARLFGERP